MLICFNWFDFEDFENVTYSWPTRCQCFHPWLVRRTILEASCNCDTLFWLTVSRKVQTPSKMLNLACVILKCGVRTYYPKTHQQAFAAQGPLAFSYRNHISIFMLLYFRDLRGDVERCRCSGNLSRFTGYWELVSEAWKERVAWTTGIPPRW